MAMAWQVHPHLPLVLAANRDEFHDRAARPMAWWEGQDILAGQDLQAGGTWLGLSREGRIGVLTNVREPGAQQAGLPSRGALVPLWLKGGAVGDPSPLQALRTEPSEQEMSQHLQAWPTNGYNLLGLDLVKAQAHCWSNRHGHRHHLEPGVYGLSNAALDTPWPKLQRLKQRLAQACSQAAGPGDPLTALLIEALADREPVADEHLPQTGVPLEWERWLSRIFIETPDARYGTRCSTVIVVRRPSAQHWQVHVVEQGWNPQGQPSSWVEQSWTLSLPPAAGA